MDDPPTHDLSAPRRVKNICKSVGSTSTAHAIPNISSSPFTTVKIMWMIFLLASTGLCVYLVLGSIRNYLSFDVVTKIRENNQFPSVFPTVSFCNKNRFTTDYSIQYLKNVSDMYDLNVFNKTAYDNMTSEELNLNTNWLFDYANYELLNLTKEQKRKLGYEIDDYLINCQFVGKPCNMTDFYWFEHPDYGNCYSYNAGFDKYGNKTKLKTTIGSSPDQGLFMVFFAGIPDDLQFLSSGSGMVVYVHNNTQSPLGLNPENINLQTLTLMAVSRLFSKKLPSPYSECQYDPDSPPDTTSDLVDLIVASGFAYTQEDCITQCYQKFQKAKCNCTFANLPSLYNTSSCISPTQKDCEYTFYNDFQNDTFIFDNCIPLCPLECNSIKYSVSDSFFEYPIWKGAYDDYDAINKLYKDRSFGIRSIESNIIAINVFLDKLAFIQMEENAAMDFVTLLSNVGGIAGLFLGVSVLSVVELFEILVRICIDFHHQTTKKNRVNLMDSNQVTQMSINLPPKKPDNDLNDLNSKI